MQFRFECTKPSEFEDNIFNDIEFPTNLKVVHEFEMDEATQWDNVMLQFAKFLDAIGYVGVFDKVSTRNEQEWQFLTTLYDDENTSNPGLSD